MANRKRKVKQNNDEETPVKRSRTKKNATPTVRTSAPRRSKVNRNDPEWLVTNEKSSLTTENLHAELCDPKTYEGFTKEDWEDLRSELPDDVPLAPDGYSIAIEFLKYNTDFRRGVREFQEDLAAGRLDPKWQAEAAEAMEQRARGDFDAYKENKFEEFWGQKQKLSHEALAGESTTLKLDVMIENGVFRVGDEFVFIRAIGRKEKRILIEKECTIIKLTKNTMTVAIPPGQDRFPRLYTESEPSKIPDCGNGIIKVSMKPEPESSPKDSPPQASTDAAIEGLGKVITPERETLLGNFESGWAVTPLKEEVHDENSNVPPNDIDRKSPDDRKGPPTDNRITHEIKNLKQLMDKIIEIDGRLDPKDQKQAPAVSPWKLIRAKRNNQDLGTLFEMREDFYVYKLPHITKAAKKI